MSSLWQKRATLTPFGLAFLGVAAIELPGDHAQAKPILAEVRRAAKEATEEAWYDSSPRGGWSFDSPLRTHAGALLAFASAGGNADGEMAGKLLGAACSSDGGTGCGATPRRMSSASWALRCWLVLRRPGRMHPRWSSRLRASGFNNQALEKVSPRVRRLRLVEADLGLKAGSVAEHCRGHARQRKSHLLDGAEHE